MTVHVTTTVTPSPTECHNINRTIVEPNPTLDCNCSDSQVKSTHSSTTSITNSSNINPSTVNSTVGDGSSSVDTTSRELAIGLGTIGLGALGFGVPVICIIVCMAVLIYIKKRQTTKNRINAINLSYELKE
jgi:hypothetical protein